MKYLVAKSFLDSQKILEQCWEGGAMSFDGLNSLHFVEMQKKMAFKPDHQLKNAIQYFRKDSKTFSDNLFRSLDLLSEMLTWKGHNIVVKSEELDSWHQTILSVSPLVILSYQIYQQSLLNPLLKMSDLVKKHFSHTAIPSVYEPCLEALCREGLIEAHMHLNGTTEPDFVWQDALNNTAHFYRHLKDSVFDSSVKEQYWQLGRFKQQDLFRLLKVAAHLRDQIISNLVSGGFKGHSLGSGFYENPLKYADAIHPYRLIESTKMTNEIQYESLFLIRAFTVLSQTKNSCLAFRFHYYLLIQSFFQRLLVQQRIQVGFDQFQKITLNGLREHTETHYQKRFKQLQGMHDNHLKHLEGRFAPKQTRHKHEKIMSAIKNGYEPDMTQPYSLALVAHFVKEEDKRKPETIITYRDLELRLKTKRASSVLLDALKKGNSESRVYFSQKHIIGFDAASNELHAAPEVFSPIYRKLAYLGYSNFTYHAGEDFVHLLSGIRAVYEAVEFLELPSGSRIGHATALGIEPELWAKRTGSTLYIKQGEWLDNLVFLYGFCRLHSDLATNITQLEQPILHFFNAVYCINRPYSIQQLIDAYNLRKLDPAIVFGWQEVSAFDGFSRNELAAYQSKDNEARYIYQQYHQAGVIKRSNKLIEVKIQDLVSLDLLRRAQNKLVELLNIKSIAIEALPSSNVRISHYKNYGEYHLMRWLGLKNEHDPMPNVVIGSDDTGIFMTNLKNEYAHVFKTVSEVYGKQKAIAAIEQLHKNSQCYMFKAG
ncbi:MAG: hypothetical protein IBX55_20875 [Methyloprofundus sp.]|nr:hypothetical protein [Methyloprofundus sp.]